LIFFSLETVYLTIPSQALAPPAVSEIKKNFGNSKRLAAGAFRMRVISHSARENRLFFLSPRMGTARFPARRLRRTGA
jgi:hypothetical protein